jgi:vitamin B12 transporter
MRSSYLGRFTRASREPISVSSLLLATLCCTVISGAAPSRTSCGRTLDADSQAVVQAQVKLYSRDSGLQFTAESDDTGQYCFEHVPTGRYLLEARAGSSLLATPTDIAVEQDNTIFPDLLLTIAPLSTEVTVTGNGSPQSASETSKELNSIDVGDALLRGEDNLSSAVRDLPGLRITQTGGPGAFTTIQMRGLRTFDTAILIDGMQLRDVSSTQADASSFISDLWFVDTARVEVLQGAGASLYGTNSIGGVVNMVTDQGGGPFHGDLDLQGGMLGQFRGVLHAGGSALNDRHAGRRGTGRASLLANPNHHERDRRPGP